jgi:hypothetical protein
VDNDLDSGLMRILGDNESVGFMSGSRYARRIALFVQQLWILVRNGVMASLQPFFALLQQVSGYASRSTAVSSLLWAFTIASGCLVACFAAVLTPASKAFVEGNPIGYFLVIIVISIVCFSMIVILLSFIVAYFWSLLSNPDALRSERFTLTKIAIQRGLKGDDLAGLREETIDVSQTALAGPTVEGGTEGGS